MATRFVGRREELGGIEGLLQRARRDRIPTAALVVGEPGSGKSSLLREAVGHGDRRRVAVSGFEPTAHIPFAALGELARRLSGVPDHGPRFEALFFGAPEVGEGALPVFEAAHRAVTGFGPLVLALDDLQWVDPQSIALVHYLLRAAESTGGSLAVIAGSRPSPRASDFETAMSGILAADRRLTIQLGGLALAEAMELARGIDPDVDAALVESLWRRSEGLPFWLESLVRTGGSSATADLIGDRLRILSEDGGMALSALVVAARPLSTADLARVLEWPADRVGEALRELETRGLVIRGLGGIRPSHDLIRESAATQVPEARRRDLHARFARDIEASAGDDLALLSAALDHRAAAGMPVSGLALRIATSPRRRLLDVASIDRLEEVARAMAPRSPDRVALQAALARLAADLGQDERVLRLWDDVGAATDDPHLIAEAALGGGRALYSLGRGAAVRARIEAARGLPLDPAAAIDLQALAADVELWLDDDRTQDRQAGAALAARALSLGEELIAAKGGVDALAEHEAAAVMRAVEAAADAALQDDRGADVLRLADLSMRLGDRIGGEARIAARIRSGFGLRALGQLEEAGRRYREALDEARRLLLPNFIAEAGQGLATVLHDLGRLEEARAVAQETMELEDRIGVQSRRWGTSRTTLRMIDVSMGRPGALEELLQEVSAHGDPHYAIGIHQLAAALLARQHGGARATEVQAHLDAAHTSSSQAGCRRCGRELGVVSAEILARIGKPAEARRALDAWTAGLTQPLGGSYDSRDLWQARATALIALAEERAEAPAALAALAASYERAGRLEDLVWTELDRGEGLRRAGDRASAVEAFERAAALAQQIKAEPLARRATRALRELGVRAWRRGAASPGDDQLGSLSAREREIVALVAQGASNREIAESFVLSPKTVERHVTNILAKVGARNRTELARLVHAGPPRVAESTPARDAGSPSGNGR